MSADCSLQVVESQHRSGDLILANDRRNTRIRSSPVSRAILMRTTSGSSMPQVPTNYLFSSIRPSHLSTGRIPLFAW